MTVLLEDLLIAARTVYGEARGEPFAGQRAVAHVIINRTRRRTGDRDHSLAATALRWLQFSAWRERDPNRARIEGVTVDDARFRTALRAVLEALDEPDPTGGATHYHTKQAPAWAETWPPKWARGRSPVYEVGAHVFYADIP